MKLSFKKPLALILALVLLLAVPMQAFAEQPIRETDYFPEKSHTDRPYSEIVFTQPDQERAEAITATIEPLLDDPTNIEEVGRLFEELKDVIINAQTMYALGFVHMMKDPTNEELSQQCLSAYERFTTMAEQTDQLIAKIGASPCRESLFAFTTEDIIEAITSAADAIDPEKQELNMKIAELQSQYQSLVVQEASQERDQAIGELYLELVEKTTCWPVSMATTTTRSSPMMFTRVTIPQRTSRGSVRISKNMWCPTMNPMMFV